jgi:hypothetical protein
MASNQFLTVADVYNPADTQLKVQAINESKMRNRIEAMKMRELYQQQARRSNLAPGPRGPYNFPEGQFVSQNAPMAQTQTAQPMNQMQAASVPQQQIQPQTPEISEEDRAATRGYKKVTAIMKNIQPMLTQAKSNPEVRKKINQIFESAEDDEDYRMLVKKRMGFDNIKSKIDEETGEESNSLEKYWTEEELQKRMEEAPNGQMLAQIVKHPGNYGIRYNKDGAVLGFYSYSKVEKDSMLDDKNLTLNEIITRAASGDKEAIKSRDAILDFERRKDIIKFGYLSPDAVVMQAQNALFDSNQLSKIPPRGPNRSNVISEMEIQAKKYGYAMPDITGKRTGYNATVLAYNTQKKSFYGDQKLADEFITDVKRVKQQVINLRTNYPAYVNASIKKVRELSASGRLGDESVLAQELDALMLSYGRMTLDSSSSISELSATAQERYNKLLNSNSPQFALIQQLENFEKALTDRMSARRRSINKIENKLREYSTFDKKKTLEETKTKAPAQTTPKQMTFNPDTGEFE